MYIYSYPPTNQPSIYLPTFKYQPDLTSVLQIPTTAVQQVQILFDKSTESPPLTVMTFILVNNDGVDPLAKARQLRTMAANADPRLANTETLAGIEVVDVVTSDTNENDSNVSAGNTNTVAGSIWSWTWTLVLLALAMKMRY